MASDTTLPEDREAAEIRSSGAPDRYTDSRMIRRFGLLYHLSGLGALLRRLEMEEHTAENIRQAAERGPLVYVLHTRSRLDWLALNRALNRRRLPLAFFTNGVRGLWFRPLTEGISEGWRLLKRAFNVGPPVEPLAEIETAVLRGRPTAIFLVEPALQGGRPVPGLIETLIQAQAQVDRPIQLVPVVVIWRRQPEVARTEVGRFLLGSQDDPNPLQKLYSAAFRTEPALVQAGEAVDLRQWISRFPDATPEKAGRALRILLRRYLYRESLVVRGPRIRPYRWTRHLVMRSPEIRQLIRDEALTTGKPEPAVQARVAKTLDQIAARFSYPAVRVAKLFFGVIWNRIFSGLDIREEDLERLRAALRSGTPVLVPCHRSHLDYLLISSVCYEHNIVIPHIVAGDNLSFWPLGAIFRRWGAFFIKRSFGGDRIFPTVFKRYLHQLIRDGFPVEFFIEGGRSRTGKLLPPKLGVLSMVLDAASEGRTDREVSLLPIAISYEQIAEEKAYARELAGSSKEAEDLGQVVRATRVIRKRFGRVYIRVGEPILASQVFAAQERPWADLSREQRQEALQTVGERLMYRIAENMALLPTALVAMALLAQRKRGVRLSTLYARAQRLDGLLRSEGATPAVSLTYGGWAVEEALSRFLKEKMLQRLEDESGDIIQIIDEKRITLEYYKNGLLHFVAPASLLAAAILAGSPAFRRGDSAIFQLFRTQVFLMRYEFTLDPEAALEDLEAAALAGLVRYGALGEDGQGGYRVASLEYIEELASITRNFLESYWLVLQGARALRSRDISLKELPTRIQEYGRGRLAVDELQLPESLSLVNLQNAVRAFREEGVLQHRTGGAGLQFDESGMAQYLADLGRLLER